MAAMTETDHFNLLLALMSSWDLKAKMVIELKHSKTYTALSHDTNKTTEKKNYTTEYMLQSIQLSFINQ